MNKPLLISSLALAIALAGCNQTTDDASLDRSTAATPAEGTGTDYGSDANQPLPGQDPMDTQGMPANMSPTDAANLSQEERQALGVLNAINENEIGLSEQALGKGVQGDVAQYARRMVDAHTQNRDRTNAMNPDSDAAMAQAKRTEGEALLATLAEHEGDAYSRAYVEAMVEGHAEALEALDSQLIPAATTPAVAAHLRETRGHVAEHLEEARRLHSDSGTR